MMTRKKRYRAFVDHFSQAMPAPTTELIYRTPFELLVAVVLSAQCTDKRVNQTTPTLFQAFPTPLAMSQASIAEVQHYIRQISYPNSKAGYLVGLSKILVKEFQAQLPDNRADLERLPGVGRKSASVILATIYQQPAMPVDTHVMRVSKRIGLVDEGVSSPLAIEKVLVHYFSQQELNYAHHWLVLHGRYICTARKPKCGQCPLKLSCRYFQQQKKPSP